MSVQGTAPVQSAAEVLTQAAHDADRWRVQAQQEADGLLSEARDEARRVSENARREADELVARARTEVARLQQVDDDARERLRRHAEDLLAEADGPREPSGT